MSTLRTLTRQYVETRQALGYKLEREARSLVEFIDFVQASGSVRITNALALQWASETPSGSPQQTVRRLRWIRPLARYISAYDPDTEIPPVDLLVIPHSPRSTPYIYRDDEVLALMCACQSIAGLTSATYQTLIGLLAATGLRIGEAIALDRDDVDLFKHQLIVRLGKFGKARQIPLALSTCEALCHYAQLRDSLINEPACDALLLSRRGTRLNYKNVHFQFQQLLARTGLDQRTPRPRIHHLRHSFAVASLRHWYEQDLDIEPRLAALATYLGHLCPSSTYWYLTATPQLLELARCRAQRYAEQRQ